MDRIIYFSKITHKSAPIYFHFAGYDMEKKMLPCTVGGQCILLKAAWLWNWDSITYFMRHPVDDSTS